MHIIRVWLHVIPCATFQGNYSFIGHSLGSIIAFDILANQNGPNSDLPSSYTTVGTEDAAFDEGEHLQPVESNSDVAKEGETGQTVLDADEHGADVASRLETFEGWSFVGNKRNNHRDLSADQLTSILTEAGLNDDQVCSLVDSLLHIKSQNLSKGPSNSSPPLSSATAPIEITSSTHRPFWVEDQAKNSDAVVRGFGMPVVTYPQLGFHVTGLFLLGSPLPLFLTARGIRQLSPDYQLPTCVMFYNIFHPFDPVAYRMETMIDPTYQVCISINLPLLL